VRRSAVVVQHALQCNITHYSTSRTQQATRLHSNQQKLHATRTHVFLYRMVRRLALYSLAHSLACNITKQDTQQGNVPERLVETLLELNLPGSGARLSKPALPAEEGVRPLDIGVSSPTCW
jgi:hypothetical protein